LATKERKISQKKLTMSLLLCVPCVPLRQIPFFWPGLAGMREFRAAASLFLFFEGVIRRD
jgi:hypothetical protein